jgi:hypothetical protein
MEEPRNSEIKIGDYDVKFHVNGFSMDIWLDQSDKMNTATRKRAMYGFNEHTPQDRLRVATEEYNRCMEMLSYLRNRSDDTEHFEDFWEKNKELWIVDLDKWKNHDKNRI